MLCKGCARTSGAAWAALPQGGARQELVQRGGLQDALAEVWRLPMRQGKNKDKLSLGAIDNEVKGPTNKQPTVTAKQMITEIMK